MYIARGQEFDNLTSALKHAHKGCSEGWQVCVYRSVDKSDVAIVYSHNALPLSTITASEDRVINAFSSGLPSPPVL